MELLLMNLFPDWAPNIHPMLVHFPIAILGIAIFFDFVAFILPREKKWWTAEATAFLYIVGAITAIIVYYTGTLAADSVNATAAAEKVMRIHRSWAWWTIWFYGIYSVVRVIFTWSVSNHYHLKYHGVFFLISLVGMFFLFETGDHGAEMVFGYGTGTGQLVTKKSNQMNQAQGPGYHSKDNGNINWVIGENAPHVLSKYFTFLEGDTASISATVKHEKGDIHALAIENPHFFMVSKSDMYSDMQMAFTVYPGDYKGDIVLAHNVHNAQNYAYMVLHPDGSAQLGRYVNGKNIIIEKGSYDPKGIKRIKLGVSGDHIHGYVNGKGILHGHSDQTGPGAIGLRLDGNGTFAFSKLNVTTVAGEADGHDAEASNMLTKTAKHSGRLQQHRIGITRCLENRRQCPNRMK